MTQASTLWPLAAYALIVVALTALMLLASHLLGERRRTRNTNAPFESGVLPVGSARLRVSARFYLIAMLFVIFDLEAVYIFAWAVAFREAGWAGYIEIMVFIVILLAALVYLWRLGALDWGPPGQRTQVKSTQERPRDALVAEQTER